MDRSRTVFTPAPATAAATAPAPTGARPGLLLMVVVWAVNFSIIKIALADLPPLAFNALRFPLASLLVFAVLRARGPIPLPAAADRGRIVTLGILGNVVYQLFFIFGLDRTRAGNAALLLAGTPILTALLSSALGHERVRPRVWVGVAATVLGMVFVVVAGGGGLDLGLHTIAGDLTMVAASVAWSIYTVGARGPIARYGSVAVTAWTLWAGTAGLVVLGLPDMARLDWDAVRPAAWVGVLYAGLLGIGLAYLLWYHAVRSLGNTRTASYSNLVPVFALAIAWAWLGEVPSVWQIAGAAIIIGGVTLAQHGGEP